MRVRPWRLRAAESDSLRPRRRRWSHGLRRGASLARRVLGVPGRVLGVRRQVTGAETGRAATATLVEPLPQVSSIDVLGDEPEANPPLLTGERTRRRQVGFAIVNACTLSSLALGMGAVFAAMHGHVQLGAALLVACVVFDGMDGALARKFRVSTAFGAQMDSLADMCSFGMATPVVAYAWLDGSTPAYVVVPACALMGACAAIRLARFNVSPKSGSHFTGVPTTIAAAIVALATLLLPDPMPVAPAVLVAVLALLMVSTFPYVKLSQLRRVPLLLWAIPVAVALVDVALAVGVIVGVYLVSGLILWAKGRGALA